MTKASTIKLIALGPLQHDGKDYGAKDAVEVPLRQAQSLVAASVAAPADAAAEKALAAAEAKSQSDAADEQAGS